MNIISEDEELLDCERQIRELKDKRDEILKRSGVTKETLHKILRARSPNKTLCQILRDLHKLSTPDQQELIEQALLIAKKMDSKLVEYAGNAYARHWYNNEGSFIDENN
jgi:predicted transcriptional regulator